MTKKFPNPNFKTWMIGNYLVQLEYLEIRALSSISPVSPSHELILHKLFS